jgi:hypothetical protein
MSSTRNGITFHTKMSNVPHSVKILVIKSFVRAAADLGIRRWFSWSGVSIRGQPQRGESSLVFFQLWQSQTVKMWNNSSAWKMRKGRGICCRHNTIIGKSKEYAKWYKKTEK